MNKLVNDLAQQCYHRYSEHNIDLEKFAELIVEESLKIMQQEWYDLNNAPKIEDESERDVGIRVGKKGEVIKLMHLVKGHFGVAK